MTQIDTLKASRPRHNFPLAAKTKTERKTIQTHAFSRQISSQTLSLLAILVEVPDFEKNSQEHTFIPPPLTRIFLSLWPTQNSSPILLCSLRKDPQDLRFEAKDLLPPRAKPTISIPANGPESKTR